jgi:hypothetical protein
MQVKAFQSFALGVAVFVLASLFVSYNRLVRSVETAAVEAGVVDRT